MNLISNYYAILGVNKDASESIIRKAYYKLSFKHHPDKGGDPESFATITEAYDILSSTEDRKIYDKKSRFGKDYNEIEELFIIDQEFDYSREKNKYEEFKKNEVLEIIIEVQSGFKGPIEYNRWIICKECGGSGKDLRSKIVIRDENGNVKGIFDSDHGCDFCEGTGKGWNGEKCNFCFGKGKIGSEDCQKCKGEKRILGKQGIKDFKIDGEETIVKYMGHFSKTDPGKVGDLKIKIISRSE